MGGGNWTEQTFNTYSSSRGRTVSSRGVSSTQGMFEDVRQIKPSMKPYKVIRECVDSEEHPNTVPVMLWLDVTGSMGDSCKRTASALNIIMKDLYKNHTDIEFLVGALGDLAYDSAPIQISQYESDIRIAEHMDNVYMEKGGGSNSYESYTAAWYMGLYHTKLDCWKRGKKGIIITIGDEPLNPYLPADKLKELTGDSLQGDVETTELYKEVIKKFDIYHVAVDDSDNLYSRWKDDIHDTWGAFIGQNLRVATIDSLPTVITQCIDDSIAKANEANVSNVQIDENTGAISW